MDPNAGAQSLLFISGKGDLTSANYSVLDKVSVALDQG